MRRPRTATREQPLLATTRGSLWVAMKTPYSQKMQYLFDYFFK